MSRAGKESASERRAFRLMVKGLKPPPAAPITKPPKKEKIEEDLPAHLKKCPACKEVKPLTVFQKNRSKPHGIGAYCKPCSNKRVLEYLKDPGNYKAHLLNQRRYYQDNREMIREKARAEYHRKKQETAEK